MKRGFLQISFAWLFGLIAGAIILFLAIFMATKLLNTGQYQSSAESQSQITALLNPLETGFQSGQVTSLTMPVETKIYNTCESQNGVFRKQTFSLSQFSFNKWSVPTQGISIDNKYIFSDNETQGKQFLLFTKPFDFPFKIADLIYMTSASQTYCFVNSPSNVHEELSNLNQANINLESYMSSCPADSITVCFEGGSSDCSSADVSVDDTRETVTKNSTTLTYSGDTLMYAAIFSDPVIYDCQVKRIMKREAEIINLYLNKATTIAREGCGSSITNDLGILKNSAENFNSPESDLASMSNSVNKLDKENQVLGVCGLW